MAYERRPKPPAAVLQADPDLMVIMRGEEPQPDAPVEDFDPEAALKFVDEHRESFWKSILPIVARMRAREEAHYGKRPT